MSALFWLSYAALWCCTALLFVAVVLLRWPDSARRVQAPLVSSQGPAAGVRFPRKSLFSLDGESVVVGSPRRAPFQLVLFTAARCRPCKDALTTMMRLQPSLHEECEIVVICSGLPSDIAEFAKSDGADSMVIADNGRAISQTLGIVATPFAFLIDRSGVIRAKGLGGSEDSVRKLLDGQSPALQPALVS
jgi:peroxiredoxin